MPSLFGRLCGLAFFLLLLGEAGLARGAVLRVLSPSDGDRVMPGEVTLLVQVRLSADEALRGVLVRVDGAEVRPRGITIDDSDHAAPLRRLRLPLRLGVRHIEITAETSLGSAASVRLALQVGPPAGADETALDPLLRPRLYVLSIGVSEYQDAALRLRFPAKDAADLARTLRRQAGGLYREVRVQLLTDANARKSAVLDGLDWLRHQMTDRDVAAIFLAGHGIRDGATGSYYFLPADADLGAVLRSMISQVDLQNVLRSLPGKVLLFLDTCFAGQVMRATERALPPDLSRFVQELVSADSGVVVFASSSGRQTSQESAAWKNGAFTRALVEGLSGKAALPGRGIITLSMLDLYVSERVKELTGGVQTPTLARPEAVQDFPIALPRPEPAEGPPSASEMTPRPPTPAPPLAPPPVAMMTPLEREVQLLRYRRNQLIVEPAGASFSVSRGEQRRPLSQPEFFLLTNRDDLARRLSSRAALRKGLFAGGAVIAALGLSLGIGAVVVARSQTSMTLDAPVSATVIGLGVSAGILILGGPALIISGSMVNPTPIGSDEAQTMAAAYNDQMRPR